MGFLVIETVDMFRWLSDGRRIQELRPKSRTVSSVNHARIVKVPGYGSMMAALEPPGPSRLMVSKDTSHQTSLVEVDPRLRLWRVSRVEKPKADRFVEAHGPKG